MTEFRDWIAAKIAAGDLPALIEYRTHAVQSHPTGEHQLPLFVQTRLKRTAFKPGDDVWAVGDGCVVV